MVVAPRKPDPEEEGEGGTRGLSPDTLVTGHISVPSSKSLAIRGLMAAGLARGETMITGLSDAEDVAAAFRVLEACGVAVAARGRAVVVVTGRPPGEAGAWKATRRVDCGESGTVARLATAVMAICPAAGTESEIAGRGSLLKRGSPALLEALSGAGAKLEPASGVCTWPLRVVSCGGATEFALDSPTSSQELSGLLFAAAGREEPTRVVVRGDLPSRPYVDLSVGVLERFGAHVRGQQGAWMVEGPLEAPEHAFAIEADASAAAVALAAGCLSGGEVVVPGVGRGSPQGDVAIVEFLREFGCSAEAGGEDLRATGRPTRGAKVDLGANPDLAPVLAAVGGAVALDKRVPSEKARTVLTGLETLNLKESLRLDVLTDAWRMLGIAARKQENSLLIQRGACNQGDVVLDPVGDHRMAFAFALMGLTRAGVLVVGPGCVAKSWPGFWEALGG